MGEVVPLRDAFGRLTRPAPPPAAGTFDAMIAGRAPIAPPITREHELEATLLILQADLERIERLLDIEPDSQPLHIPAEVAEALYRSMRAIARVKR